MFPGITNQGRATAPSAGFPLFTRTDEAVHVDPAGARQLEVATRRDAVTRRIGSGMKIIAAAGALASRALGR